MPAMDYAPLPGPIAAFVRAEMERLDVPGVAVGLLHDGRFHAQGFGLTSVRHPLSVTPETLFQIGSTSKTFTATVAMMLVEEGRLDLDARVRDYLPAFRLESEEDAERLTVTHLVTHHGGWVGDYFRDTGRGADAIARIVEKMARSPQVVPAGTAFSYNNAGFYVLGRIIELLEGQPFDEVVTSRVFAPLGMELSTYLPEDALVHRVAVGHIRTAAGPVVATPWRMPRSIGPGGGIISNVPDQLRYAAFHLGESVPAAAEPPLRPETVAFMQTPLAEAGSMCEQVGVSWMLDTIGETRVVKHGGATNGFLSSFDLLPDRGFGCTVLTNSDSGRELRQTVLEALRLHFTGVGVPEVVPAASQPPLAEYAGNYASRLASLNLRVADGRLAVHETAPDGGRAQVAFGSQPAPLTFTAPDRMAVIEGPRRGERAEFLRGADGRIAFLRWDGRLARRTG